ncbi:MAG TPA: hypothetical protein PLD20_05715 [Blastocatellia bacterium]|nr:hypothetical protein [Blastocatellia bacterium]HMX25685.1 hypothetical protein [Blastocatellia bacterium]HMZ17404.1 hypothetical protein [Blastocatellia bacterium]HNG29224.1 hypothetical protein [Blastocatellia bacterium]
MPINPELKHLYPPDWKAISRRIRFERAGGRCERCGVPNGALRAANGEWWFSEDVMDAEGEPVMDVAEAEEILDVGKLSLIVLTTAHLNHDPTDNREENLAALCQKCHLAHDLKHHLQSRRRNREKASKQQRLFEW